MAVVLATLLVFAAVVAVVEWRRWDSLNHTVAVRNRISATAAAEAEALFTYDYQDLAAAQKRILAGAGGSFARQESAAGKSVATTLTRLKATGTSTVEEVSVTGDAGGQAAAFVVVDTQAHATGGATKGVQYLSMTLGLDGGQWKVDAVQSLVPPGN